MPEDLMRYDQLAQLALRNGVVREALRRVEREGLPGEHHFYVTFNTSYPGVGMSDRMRERYPREMTIVLQHQFEGLRVHEDGFEVRLSFDNIPEKLSIPFEALKAFFDPAVPFGLQFEVVEAQHKNAAGAPAKATAVEPEVKKLPKRAAAQTAEKTEDGENGPAEGEHKVVSLDSFRKK
jgi:hypothetical protein